MNNPDQRPAHEVAAECLWLGEQLDAVAANGDHASGEVNVHRRPGPIAKRRIEDALRETGDDEATDHRGAEDGGDAGAD